MNLQDAVTLIQPAFPKIAKGCWADLGCGEGLFTIALAGLLKEGSTIYAIDENRAALNKIKPRPGIELKMIIGNFEKDDLPLHDLDGILMANSLHYVKDKISFLKKSFTWMKKESSFFVVEYDTEKSNQWVPYPISFLSLQKIFSEFGFTAKKIGEHRSIYNRAGMYAASVPRLST